MSARDFEKKFGQEDAVKVEDEIVFSVKAESAKVWMSSLILLYSDMT